MKIVWSPLSLQRIEEVADYIALDSPGAANTWIDSIFEKVELLLTNPEIGRIVPETAQSQFRELFHGNYRIIYSYTSAQIAILTVRHCKQILPVNEVHS